MSEYATRKGVYTQEEWIAQALSLFGPNPLDWRFKCPACQQVQGIMDLVDTGLSAEDASLKVYQYCVGNFSEHDCDWKAFGLFTGPVVVKTDKGKVYAFDFAD